MKGFRDSTKTIKGHHFASGGIVAPKPRAAAVRESVFHPIIPRPHVMPNQHRISGLPKMPKLARGGHALSDPVPYSEIEVEHPRRAARPGYASGGPHIKPSHKGKFTKRMTGSKHGHLTDADIQEGLRSKNPTVRREANFARMARRGWKPLSKASGGGVTAPQARKIADQEVSRHVRAPKPAGHGVRSGGLGFLRTPLCGGGRSR